METDALEAIGLSANEAKAYVSLLKLGQATAAEISRESGVYRTNAYDCLAGLVRKGLASRVVKNNKTYFEAADPKKIAEMARRVQERLREEIPKILSMKRREAGVRAQVLEGRAGVKALCEDILATLQKGEEWVDLGSAGRATEVLSKVYLLKLHRRRIKKGIRFRVIFADNERSRKLAAEYAPLSLTECRFLEKGYLSQAATHVYGNKIAIVIYSIPLVFLLESAEVAESFRSHFESLWKVTKRG
jgi:sugar-specific transcriptional regulator TrmB